MRSSLVRRFIAPPAERDVLDAVERRARAHVRMGIVLVSLGIDAFIALTMRNAPVIRGEALSAFLAINVPLLVLDLAITFSLLRGQVARPRVEAACVVVEATTVIVWLQMTGTVSSYFLLAAPLVMILHRLLMGWTAGIASALTMNILYATAFGLEQAGLLRPAPLFVGDLGSTYNAPVFRLAAYCSIQSVFFLAFAFGNFMDLSLREKDRALSNARSELARAVDAGRVGRLSGRTLGKYRLLELLGRGGMGEVYQAQHVENGALFAIKVLHPHLCDDEHIARFEREIEIAARIPEARVATVHDVGTSDDGLRYFVMDLLVGEDLGALLRRRGRLSVDELLPIVDALAEVLDRAHRSGIVHRDLKPQNVFLAADGLRLLDFGVARLVNETGLTSTRAVVGTPGYLAPEQVAEGYGDPRPQTDVFALGAIVYRALTGQPAFPSRHAAGAAYEALHVHPRKPTELAADLPEGIDCVLALALAKSPDDRYPSPLELARDLRAAACGTLDAHVRARSNVAESGATLTAAG